MLDITIVSRLNQLSEMPFYRLSDAQMIWENETSRQCILDRMKNNGFIKYMENSNYYQEIASIRDSQNYYDTEEFDIKIIKKKIISMIHVNCRMLSKNRGKIISFFKSLDEAPPIIILSSQC